MVLEASSEAVLRGQRALWRVEPSMPAALREALTGRSPMLCHLLYRRGYTTPEAIEAFFAAATISHDPFLLPDMTQAVQRIALAVRRGERVAVYGDFDCDGITSAAILVTTLQALGLAPISHIPTRGDGHGLQPEALAGLADEGVDLVITADCGIAAIEEVNVARGMRMDVIITDHHAPRADGSLPACLVVAPTRHDSIYPCRFLCGAGVAYKVAQALRREMRDAPDPDDLLDLVALGTVADVVPLQDENRSLVLQGLEKLRHTERAGLLALFQAAGIEQGRIDPVGLGFYLAPRLNAANRMATPQLAYDLIMATEAQVAASLAEQLSEYNRQRQALVAENLEVVMRAIGDPALVTAGVLSGQRPPVLIQIGEWPAGISGLLASKLVDTYGLPAFVGGVTDEGTVAVSARGTTGSHIDEILEACEASVPGGLFVGFGGHARAGGFRVAPEQADLALRILAEQAQTQIPLDGLGAVLTVDAEVSLHKLTVEAAGMVRSLAPFGTGFSEPLFLTRGVTVRRLRPLRDGKHVRLKLQQGRIWLDGVYFNVDPDFLQLQPGATLDLVFHLQLDEWQGASRAEIKIRDWRVAA